MVGMHATKLFGFFDYTPGTSGKVKKVAHEKSFQRCLSHHHFIDWHAVEYFFFFSILFLFICISLESHIAGL